MKNCTVFHDSNITDVFLKNDTIPQLLDSLWTQNSSPSFHVSGSASMVNFDQARGENKGDCKVENCDDELDSCFHHHPPEKKRRLKAEQVEFLEKSFEVENKLEPDRKIQVAKELGLQPRQVAIWFQNRRARCKTKFLEKEYDSLKSCYSKLKADYDTLFSDNQNLKNEVHLLRQKLVVRENDPINPLDFQARSDSSGVLEIEAADVFEGDKSDFSQDEDESLVCFPARPKLEVECYDDLHPNSCNLGFPAQNQGTWFCQY